MAVINPQATTESITQDHINGLSGLAIAEKYGMDDEKVKSIIRDLDASGAFEPKPTPTPETKASK
jgi:hypothetical protein